MLDWQPPHARWFVGGKLNICYNCLDHQLSLGRRNKAAIIWEGEPGERRTLTYWELSREVNRFANVLKKLGVQRGDRVAIYMPMIPELPVAMLACARIGAVHSVVFGGFSAEALRDRINDCGAKVLITADGGYRRGGLLPLKHDADYALLETPSIEHVIVVRRGNFPLRMKEGRDHWYQDLVAEAAVVGVPHEIKGQAICAFATVKETAHASRELERELKDHVVRKIDAIARPDQIIFSADLPKTRSGKIMRRLLRDIAVGQVLGDTTTLADASVIESLKRQYEEKEA